MNFMIPFFFYEKFDSLVYQIFIIQYFFILVFNQEKILKIKIKNQHSHL